jgi:hypothetical protein
MVCNPAILQVLHVLIRHLLKKQQSVVMCVADISTFISLMACVAPKDYEMYE